MKILRALFYLLLVGYLSFLGIMAFSGHRSPSPPFTIPSPSARSIQWGFRIKEIATKQPRYMARAKKLFVDSRGRTFLSKEVVIEIPSSHTFIYSEKCEVSPGKNRIEFPGRVRVKSETGTFSGEKSLYLARKGVIRLKGRVSFKIGEIEGSAEGGRMDLEKKTILLFKPRFSSGNTHLEGGRIKVYEDKMTADLRGRPAKMESENTLAFAPLMSIDMKEKRVNSVFMPAGGRVFEKGRRIVGRSLKFWTTGRIEGEKTVARWGARKLFAEHIYGKREKLHAIRAFIQEKGLSLQAENLTMTAEEIQAEGKVHGKMGNSSFSSDYLKALSGEKILKGNVRIIKDGNIITCREAEEKNGYYFLKEATIISPQGFKLQARLIEYTPQKIILKEGASIRSQDILISGPEIEITINGGRLTELAAENPGRVVLGRDSARCDNLKYIFKKEKAVLQGKVLLKSTEHGEVKGERVVVYPKTGSFEIEGKGRTTSEIKK